MKILLQVLFLLYVVVGSINAVGCISIGKTPETTTPQWICIIAVAFFLWPLCVLCAWGVAWAEDLLDWLMDLIYGGE